MQEEECLWLALGRLMMDSFFKKERVLHDNTGRYKIQLLMALFLISSVKPHSSSQNKAEREPHEGGGVQQ